MLPSDRRISRSDEFATVVRRGRRLAAPTVVVHLLVGADRYPARVGFVVSKAVGGAVVRHRVVRRLRAQVAARWDRLPEGSLLVVRALPPAGEAGSGELARDLDLVFDRLLTKEAA